MLNPRYNATRIRVVKRDGYRVIWEQVYDGVLPPEMAAAIAAEECPQYDLSADYRRATHFVVSTWFRK